MAYAERLQIKFNRTPSTYIEDVAVITMHFTGASNAPLDNTIRAAVEARFATYWTTAKTWVSPLCKLAEYRWYNQQVYSPSTPSPLLRATAVTEVAGTGAGTVLPPQCSVSMTLETAQRRRWGRFYLPDPDSGNLATGTGRLATSRVDSMATALQTFIQGCKTDGAYPVIWSPRGTIADPSLAGSTLPVTGVRVDDIVDIIRSRRWQASPYRKSLAIT